MYVTSEFDQLPARPRVVAIGNFDGVHLGHQALFQRSIQLATRYQGIALALAFHPHPAQVLGFPVLAITNDHDRLELIAKQGVAAYFALPFDRDVAEMTPQEFVKRVLLEGLRAQAVVVGFNFTFGRRGAGTPELLKQLLAEHGVPVEIIPPIMLRGETVSSTRIRQCLRQGELGLVEEMLGRPYSLSGIVEHGDQRGRTIGYPTANLTDLQGLELPPYGVYAVTVAGIGQEWPTWDRPSYPQTAPSLEVHILDWQGDLYGQRIQVILRRYLRSERRFASLNELLEQLDIDRGMVREPR